MVYFLNFIYFIADLIAQRIYWTDFIFGYIKSAKLDGSDVQLITSGLTLPFGIDIYNNDIYFTDYSGKLYKQSKSPESSKIQIHSDRRISDVKVYYGPGTYNVIKLVIITLVSSFKIKVLQIY